VWIGDGGLDGLSFSTKYTYLMKLVLVINYLSYRGKTTDTYSFFSKFVLLSLSSADGTIKLGPRKFDS
jgi:hypothetical protein